MEHAWIQELNGDKSEELTVAAKWNRKDGVLSLWIPAVRINTWVGQCQKQKRQVLNVWQMTFLKVHFGSVHWTSRGGSACHLCAHERAGEFCGSQDLGRGLMLPEGSHQGGVFNHVQFNAEFIVINGHCHEYPCDAVFNIKDLAHERMRMVILWTSLNDTWWGLCRTGESPSWEKQALTPCCLLEKPPSKPQWCSKGGQKSRENRRTFFRSLLRKPS